MNTKLVFTVVGVAVLAIVGITIAKAAINAFTNSSGGGSGTPPVKSIDDLVKSLSSVGKFEGTSGGGSMAFGEDFG